MSKFDTLEKLYQMTTPADLSGKLNLGFGTDKLNNTDSLKMLLSILLEDSARGARDISSIIMSLKEIMSKASDDVKDQLEDLITVVSSVNSDINEFELKELVGKNLTSIIDGSQNISMFALRSPFISPSVVGANKVDIFLNSMPSIMASQMVPYLDVEFQIAKDFSDKVQSPGLYKFLLGAVDTSSLSKQDQAMINGRKTIIEQNENKGQFDYSGMEMFTSPQTLVNMDSLTSAGGVRYIDVIDPFRPFVSIMNLEISCIPTVGIMKYKTAKLSLKLHDRSRLTEFSELIRPRAYNATTIWLTYGWLAPNNQTGNAYADYINQNMLRREAYSIVNSAFTFDQVGQITVNLELATKGAIEARVSLIREGEQIASITNLKKLGQQISDFRKKTLKEAPEGVGSDVRIYQILDAAGAGEFPEFSTKEVNATIKQVRDSIGKSKLDRGALKKLVNLLNEYYQNNNNKFDFKESIKKEVTDLIKQKFDECLEGDDGFLPSQEKADKLRIEPELWSAIDKIGAGPTKEQKVPDFKLFNRKYVSFGKLFSVFALPAIVSQKLVNEVQVYFYAMNEQCGPISLHSCAEFPIDMPVLLDQYRNLVVERGGENLTLEDFMQTVINSQFLDIRAVGYGFKDLYKPYDPKDHDPEAKTYKNGKTNQKAIENRQALQTAKYGGFKMPSMDMYVEVLHKNDAENGQQSQADLISILDVSAKKTNEESSTQIGENKAYTIMRIHIYDKQLNPYKEQASIFRFGENGQYFGEASETIKKSEIVKKRFNQNTLTQLNIEQLNSMLQSNDSKGKEGFKIIGAGNSQTIKDYVSNTVPKIIYGANGTTVLAANLASNADPLLSTVNMMSNGRVTNSVAPNGGGDYGLPVRVVPAKLSLSTLGCPLASMFQTFFVDFNTGTTLDNFYAITALNHHFQPGKFETSWTMAYSDAYAKFTGAPTIVEMFQQLLDAEKAEDDK